MSGSARRGGGPLAAAVAIALVLVAGLGAFVLGVMWIADFDDSDDTTGPAGLASLLLAGGILVGVVLGVARRSWSALSAAVLVSGALAALPWLSLL